MLMSSSPGLIPALSAGERFFTETIFAGNPPASFFENRHKHNQPVLIAYIAINIGRWSLGIV